jgi:hypothetical protein
LRGERIYSSQYMYNGVQATEISPADAKLIYGQIYYFSEQLQASILQPISGK